MARARNIKAAFFQNEILGSLDPLARLLFIGMWTIADFKGCLEFRPKRIKAQLLPYDECDVLKLAINLDKSGFISIYSVQGKRYIKIVNFTRHQNPHKNEREAGSDIPDFEEKHKEINTLEKIAINSEKIGSAPADSLFLIPDLLIPDTGYLITEKAPNKKNIDGEFEKLWQMYPKRPGANKSQALKAWNARLKEGASVEEMQHGVYRYRAYCKTMNVDSQYIKHAATFLGPDKHYLSDWKATNHSQDFANRLTGKKGDNDEFTIDA